jgi:hypothetical protein
MPNVFVLNSALDPIKFNWFEGDKKSVFIMSKPKQPKDESKLV